MTDETFARAGALIDAAHAADPVRTADGRAAELATQANQGLKQLVLALSLR